PSCTTTARACRRTVPSPSFGRSGQPPACPPASIATSPCACAMPSPPRREARRLMSGLPGAAYSRQMHALSVLPRQATREGVPYVDLGASFEQERDSLLRELTAVFAS